MDRLKMLQKILQLETLLTNGTSSERTKDCLRSLTDDELRAAYLQLKDQMSKD